MQLWYTGLYTSIPLAHKKVKQKIFLSISMSLGAVSYLLNILGDHFKHAKFYKPNRKNNICSFRLSGKMRAFFLMLRKEV